MNFIDKLQIIDEMPTMNNRKSLFNNNIPGGVGFEKTNLIPSSILEYVESKMK